MAAPRCFRHADFALVRASTDSGGLHLPQLDLHTAEHAATTGRDWLSWLASQDHVWSAFQVASPALCEQIEKAISGRVLDRKQWRRLLVSVCLYVLRWQQRPTPFGLFAGVTTASTGLKTQAKFGQQHRLHWRANPSWLHSVLHDLEHDPRVLAASLLVVNNAGTVRGERFVVPKYLPGGNDREVSAGMGEIELALRRTAPVNCILVEAGSPIRGQQLIERFRATFPHASGEQITTMLGELVAHNVLVTDLRAPAFCADPAQHLLDRLTCMVESSVEPLSRRIGQLRNALRTIPEPSSQRSTIAPVRPPLPTEPSPRTEDSPPVQGTPTSLVDLELDGQVVLPETVLQEAEMAASTLLRVSPSPFGTAAWRDYHVRFRDRYGSGAMVPVQELVSDAGLGFPTGFLGAAREHGARVLTDRDAVVQSLVQEAVLDRRTEVVLSEELLDKLAVGDQRAALPPDRVELAFTVHAASPAAIDRDRFELWVTGAPAPTNTMLGRFADLLDEHAQHRLAGTYPGGDAVMVAQLSFPPRLPANEAVTRSTDFLPWLLPIGEHPPAAEANRVLRLDELAVTATSTQFFLIHRPSGKPVHPYVPHALEPTVATPPLVRFLAELPIARRAMFGPFDFGATRTLRFLPRIRYRRSVLAPARWLLYAHDLPGPRATGEEWQSSWQAWRRRWQVPAHVVLTEGEQRLPLDLDDPTQASLLRVRLHRDGSVELREAGDPQQRGWAGRPCEFVVPLTTSEPRPTAPRTGDRLPISGSQPSENGAFPGTSSLILAQLEGHPQRFDAILTGHVPQLQQHLAEQTQRLWFRRHHDTTHPESGHYLQLWLRLTAADHYGPVATRLAEWADELRAAGLASQLSFETAWAQPTKYGGDLTSTEQVFSADSAAAIAEIAFADRIQLPREAVAAVSMSDVATALAPDRETGWHMLTTVLPQQTGPLDAAAREHALELAHQMYAEPQAHAELRVSWQHRREALAEYRARLDRAPEDVLRALLHEHVRRTVAASREKEETTNRLARAVALNALARRKTG